MLASRAHLAGELNANPFGDMAHHSLFPNVLEIFAARACAGPMPLNIQQKNPQIHMNVVVSAFHHDDGAGPQRRTTTRAASENSKRKQQLFAVPGNTTPHLFVIQQTPLVLVPTAIN